MIFTGILERSWVCSCSSVVFPLNMYLGKKDQKHMAIWLPLLIASCYISKCWIWINFRELFSKQQTFSLFLVVGFPHCFYFLWYHLLWISQYLGVNDKVWCVLYLVEGNVFYMAVWRDNMTCISFLSVISYHWGILASLSNTFFWSSRV